MKFACHCECSHVGVHWPVHNVVCAQWSGGTRLSTFFSSLSSNAKLFTFAFSFMCKVWMVTIPISLTQRVTGVC